MDTWARTKTGGSGASTVSVGSVDVLSSGEESGGEQKRAAQRPAVRVELAGMPGGSSTNSSQLRQRSAAALRDDMLLDAGYLKSVYTGLDSDAGEGATEDVAFAKGEADKPSAWWVNPYSDFRTRWDLFLVIVLTYNGFAIPLRLGFNLAEDLESPVFWMDRMIDFLFLVDVVLNFRTGVINRTGQVEYSNVARKYLTSWFFLDLASAIPYELLFLAITGTVDDGSTAALAAPKLLRTARAAKILKMLKLLRLLRLRNIFARWEKALVLKHSMSTVIKFFCFIFFIAHWCACAFFAIGANTADNWLEEQGLAPDDDTTTTYVAAFYWSLSTITTIGYGDISARNPSERLFAVAAMIVGSAVYAYGITNIITLVSNINADKLKFRDRMDRLNTYMHFRNLPKTLQADIRNFFYERSGGENWHELLMHERDILNDLSPLLRTKVALLVNKRVIEAVPFFYACSPRFVLDIIMALTPEYFPPNEFVLQEGDVADRMFLVAKGRVDVLKWGKYRVTQLGPGSYFGEMALLAPPEESVRSASVRTQTYCDLRSLSYAALEAAVVKHPSARVRVLKAFVKAARQRREHLAGLMAKWTEEDPDAAAQAEEHTELRVKPHLGLADSKTLDSFYIATGGVPSVAVGELSTLAGLQEVDSVASDSDLSEEVDTLLSEPSARFGAPRARPPRPVAAAGVHAAMEGGPESDSGDSVARRMSSRRARACKFAASRQGSAAGLRQALEATNTYVRQRSGEGTRHEGRVPSHGSSVDHISAQSSGRGGAAPVPLSRHGSFVRRAGLGQATAYSSMVIPAPNSLLGGMNFLPDGRAAAPVGVVPGGLRQAALRGERKAAPAPALDRESSLGLEAAGLAKAVSGEYHHSDSEG